MNWFRVTIILVLFVVFLLPLPSNAAETIVAACGGPWYYQQTRIQFKFDGVGEYCDRDQLKLATCLALRALALAWWDARSVYCAQPEVACLSPWLGSPVENNSYVVPQGYVTVWIHNGVAQLSLKGYPPASEHAALTALDATAVAENLRRAFVPDSSAISKEDINTVKEAFKKAYFGLLEGRVWFRCSNADCPSSHIAWFGRANKIRLCERFFGPSSARSQARTLVEELIHQFPDIGHARRPGTPRIEEANFYQMYLWEHYLDPAS